MSQDKFWEALITGMALDKQEKKYFIAILLSIPSVILLLSFLKS